MPSYKIGRVNSDLQFCLAELIREVKDPRVDKLVSIVKVDVTGDLSQAKIYVSTLGGGESTAQTVKGLKSAAGYLRRECGMRLKLRKMPELLFIADDSIAHSANISRIIDSFNK